jgi:hypothetical protein
MNRLVPVKKFIGRDAKANKLIGQASVVMDDRGLPVGFFFGRDTFISLLTAIDEQFEKKSKNLREGYDNFAGRIIDVIEERLPVNPKFVREMESSILDAQKHGWVDISQITQTPNA